MTNLLSADESHDWLIARMRDCGIRSLAELEEATGVNKGTLSRYFRQLQRPSIDVIPGLCRALQVSPATLLWALGASTAEDQRLLDESR
ncbi:Cro/C1-type helix-turn-helix DNA-binding protein [Microbacteriaceae bacterium MWH-Ta3]|nr:Cro/C1-type helix-turn-helix DNA-binding protein [Microbacteriaceae bacterium MWH-Ta3]